MIRALKDGKNEGVAATTKSAGSSRLWLGLTDPRIVRVSRAAGGKDRHSKVCTVKGLRDRRVRLSVQTAIELYELQDKLGLNQPSKVVDWLLTAAQQAIDKLPPLQFPPHFFPSSSGTVALRPPPASPPGSDRCDVGQDMQYHQLDGANQEDCSMGGYLSQLLLCPPGRLVQQPLMIQSLANYPANSAFHVVDSGGGLLKALDYFSRAQQQ